MKIGKTNVGNGISGLALCLILGACASIPKPDAEVAATDDEAAAPASAERPAAKRARRGKDASALRELLGKQSSVVFDFDSATLDKAAQRALDDIARGLKRERRARLRIEGHTDERGTREYNLALGKLRADVVRAHLVKAGVKKSRLESVSFGEEKPVVRRSNESAWARNRRTELRLQ